ncbi:LRCH3 protein, partial [Alcedo cyanopectus]|nr:LRCH3 protein [Ceyx cyanopectus]
QVEHDLDQIDYIDSCATEEEEEEVRQPKCMDSASLSSQFMAYIDQRRISNEGSPVKSVSTREFQRTEDTRRCLHQNRPPADSPYFLSSHHSQVPNADPELQRRHVERTRREAQLAALQYEEERMRTKQIQRDAVIDFVKQKASLSPQKQSPLDSECPFPSRRSQHTDDSALLVVRSCTQWPFYSLSGLNQESCAPTLPNASTFSPVKSDDRSTISPGSPTTQTVHLSPAYPGHAAPPSYRNPSQRPESFLFRAAVRDEATKAVTASSARALSPANESADARVRQNSKQREEELELIEQLRKNIESRLKVSLPSDLGAALTDGVVLCHLANHVRPRSVPSIHVPSPAVPKLTMAKCRRNVENFLEACRRIGVPQDNLCSPSDILQLNLSVKRTVETLLSLGTDSEESSLVSLSIQLWGFVVFYCTLMLTLCMFYRWVFFL